MIPIGAIRRRVEISIEKHGSKLIAIAGHFDCAGNPADKEIQLKHILKAIKTIRSWHFDAQAIGLWIDERCNVMTV